MEEFRDPLTSLPQCASYPAPESHASSELSSILDDPDEWYERRAAVLRLLHEDYVPHGPGDDTVKVLETFVVKLPKGGQLAIMSEIISLRDDQAKLRQLRNFLVDAILKPMMTAGGKQPQTPITSALFPDAEAEIEASMSTIQASFRRNQGRLKAACLQRDGYRCAITGKVDAHWTHKVPQTGRKGSRTQCAHILPFALRNFDEENACEKKNKATIWWALHRYFPELKDRIGPESINQHENALTMATQLHVALGSFDLAFEPLGDEEDGVPEVVTLASGDPTVPLPDPEYFRVHLRISEILDASGIREKINDAWEKEGWDPENPEPDGSTDVGTIFSRKMLMNI
ncbi:hypothetical protein SPI_08082 [Niveomyces insectorum RCEF 264]|uniref:HNH nuclease domain-containing protein n=1 Tax=Niveomyces insectorum RCEF 264 TaxID=1081102 RepID=A0A162IE63_9HYPO|nr:hypothetical protein SPI_08082 [Niveomyces insectorum RCEF 264]